MCKFEIPASAVEWPGSRRAVRRMEGPSLKAPHRACLSPGPDLLALGSGTDSHSCPPTEQPDVTHGQSGDAGLSGHSWWGGGQLQDKLQSRVGSRLVACGALGSLANQYTPCLTGDVPPLPPWPGCQEPLPLWVPAWSLGSCTAWVQAGAEKPGGRRGRRWPQRHLERLRQCLTDH